MRTLIFIAAGLLLLGMLQLFSRPHWRGRAALGFIVVWLLVSAVNLSQGLRAGYTLGEELLVHLFLFGIPALAALWAWRQQSTSEK
ncbi:hypothetical protein [Alloalcanivorax xenomutans]|uniref:hypothetical protein n=1 Tax=Alloalcanivorax xenomutans TaxID=1094342 RepID=UPI0009B6C6E7|nr:hypothetical protein [Alloalcanivorax xenomutans]ARB46121.1 hypothetical protein P40_12535 [Alloalcanivorax xenomutans]